MHILFRNENLGGWWIRVYSNKLKWLRSENYRYFIQCPNLWKRIHPHVQWVKNALYPLGKTPPSTWCVSYSNIRDDAYNNFKVCGNTFYILPLYNNLYTSIVVRANVYTGWYIYRWTLINLISINVLWKKKLHSL